MSFGAYAYERMTDEDLIAKVRELDGLGYSLAGVVADRLERANATIADLQDDDPDDVPPLDFSD